jgi:hypothetical protein
LNLQAQVMLGMVPMPASAAEAAHMNGGPPQQPQYDPPYESEPLSYQQYDAPPYAEHSAQQPYGSAPMQTEYAYGSVDGYGGNTPQYDSSAPDYVPPPQGYDAHSGGYGQQGPEGGGQQQNYGIDPRQQQPAAAPNPQHPHMSQQAPYSPPPQASAPQQPEQQQPLAQAAAPGQPPIDPEQQKGACLCMNLGFRRLLRLLLRCRCWTIELG